MTESTFTFRVDNNLKKEFKNLAESNDRSSAQLLRDFMRDYIKQQKELSEHDQWLRSQIQIGLHAANTGDLIPGEEVESEAIEWRSKIRNITHE